MFPYRIHMKYSAYTSGTRSFPFPQWIHLKCWKTGTRWWKILWEWALLQSLQWRGSQTGDILIVWDERGHLIHIMAKKNVPLFCQTACVPRYLLWRWRCCRTMWSWIKITEGSWKIRWVCGRSLFKICCNWNSGRFLSKCENLLRGSE
jgi:hypothetical protein